MQISENGLNKKRDEQKKKLETDLRSIFWDVDVDQLDIVKHAALIITQAINYGSVAVIQHVFQVYSHETIRSVLESPIRGSWYPKTYGAFCFLLDVPPNNKAINKFLVRKKVKNKMDIFFTRI